MKKVLILVCLSLIACGGVKKKPTTSTADTTTEDAAKKAAEEAAAKQKLVAMIAVEADKILAVPAEVKKPDAADDADENKMNANYTIEVVNVGAPTICTEPKQLVLLPKDLTLKCEQDRKKLTCSDSNESAKLVLEGRAKKNGQFFLYV